MTNTLNQGQQLGVGEHLDSPGGRATLVLQSDGNLVLYRTVDHQAVWASNTVASGSVRAVMQTDGNFVLYDAHGRPHWATGTLGNSGLRLVLQDDGNLVVYLGSVAHWASGTSGSLRDRGPDRLIPPQELDLRGSIRSPSGQATLELEDRGGLILRRNVDGGRLWSTVGGGNYAKMQSDGNLVIYATGHHPLWASNTAGHEGAYLVLQDDGNLVIYDDAHALWATNTAGQVTEWESPHVPEVQLSAITSDGVTASAQLDRQLGGGHPWHCAFVYTRANDAAQWGFPEDTELGNYVFTDRAVGLPADTDFVVYLLFHNEFGQRYLGPGVSCRTTATPTPTPTPEPTSGTTSVSVPQDAPDAWSYSTDVPDPNGPRPRRPALIGTVQSTTYACTVSIGGSTRLIFNAGDTVGNFAGLPVRAHWSVEFSGQANDRPDAIPFRIDWHQ